MVHGRGCNLHRCTTTFSNVEIVANMVYHRLWMTVETISQMLSTLTYILLNPLTGNHGWTRAANWQLSGKLGPGGYTRACQTTVNRQCGFTRSCQSKG